MNPTDINTLEGNKLIAKFMGFKMVYHQGELAKGIKKELWRRFHDEDDTLPMGSLSENQLHYHSSWDWLIPVVENIAKDGYSVTLSEGVEINENKFGCKVYIESKIGNQISYIENITPIEATWLSVIEFIHWYNNKHK